MLFDEEPEKEEITGVFIGKRDGRMYAIFYGVEGNEYLAQSNEQMMTMGWDGWNIVSWKDEQGTETALMQPVPAPSPLLMVTTLMMTSLIEDDDDQIVI
jgi:hypothetical protein